MQTSKTYTAKKLPILIPILSGIYLLILGIKGYFEQNYKAFLLIAIFSGVMIAVSILNFFPFICSLIKTPKGLMVKAFFRKTFVNWNEIESFDTKKVLFQDRIAIHFKPTYGKKFLGIPIGKRRNNFTAVLPIQYDVKAEELQNTLESFNKK